MTKTFYPAPTVHLQIMVKMTKTWEKLSVVRKVTMEDTRTEMPQEAGTAETLHTQIVIQKQNFFPSSFQPKSRDLLHLSAAMSEGRSNLSQHSCSETHGEVFRTKPTFDQPDNGSGGDKYEKVSNSDRSLARNSSVTENRGEEIQETNEVQMQRQQLIEKSFVHCWMNFLPNTDTVDSDFHVFSVATRNLT